MTTNTHTAAVRSIYEVHPDPTDVVSGLALVTYIASVAARRERLKKAIVSAMFDENRGIGILVRDAGMREHLANALGFDRTAEARSEFSVPEGTGYARRGTIEGVDVIVWNVEP